MLKKKALELAKKYHAGQVDKLGVPYMEHVLAVANGVQTTEERVVALLHDVLEDTICTREVLVKEGIPLHLVEAVEAMTRREGESYMEFIKRVGKNSIARAVKLSDLKHNLDADGSRLKKALKSKKEDSLDLKKTTSLKERYKKAIVFLEAK